MATLTLTFF